MHPRRRVGSCVLLLALAGCTTGTTPAPTPTPAPSTASQTPSTTTPSPAATTPQTTSLSHPCVGSVAKPVTHVVVILMENKAEKSVIGSSHAPYLNQLAAECGQATGYHGVAHPSLPNYLALTGGDTFDVTDDGLPPTHPIHAATIFGQLHGNWRAYQESMTLPCQKSVRDHLYAPRHNPAAYFTALTDCQLHDVALPADPTFDAAFTFVTPNLQNDMHDGSIERGDAWVAAFVAKVVTSPQYEEGSLALFITWDENDGPIHVAGNQIPLLVVAPSVVPGTQVTTTSDHYSLLATWQDLLGLARIGHAVHATSLAAAFHL